MRMDISVTVQTKTTSYDSERFATEVWTASTTTERANKQPLSGELAFEQYGISDAGITNVFFLKTSSSATEGTGRIVHGSDTYGIYRLEKYPNHWEAIVKPVVGL